MNKVFQINLAGVAFTIDENAFGILLDYLDSLKAYFKNSEGRDEIIFDIESRIAELFQENLSTKSIIDIRDVNAAIERMGTTQDFQDESVEDEQFSREQKKYKTGRRRFRDEENGEVAGICAGLAAYFGIQDVVWVRILFIILFFSGGLSILIYLVLWAIIPQAKTSADRLAMKGEKINISNIAKDVEEGMEQFAHKMTEFGESFKSKKKTWAEGENPSNIIKKGFSVLSSIISSIFRIVVKILKPLFYIFCIIALIAAVIAWVGLIFGLYKASAYSSFIVAGPVAISYMVNGLVFLSLGIPLALIMASLLKWVFKTEFPRRIRNGLWGFWAIGLAILFSLSMWTIREFKTNGTITEDFDMSAISGDTLILNWNSFYSRELGGNHVGPTFINNDKVYMQGLGINLKNGTSDQFEAKIHKSAKGMDLRKAKDLASDISLINEVSHNMITVTDKIHIRKPNKWRNQKAELEISIPTGKFIKFEGKNYNVDAKFNGNSIRPRWLTGHVWQMTDKGLICPSYILENSYQETRTLETFQHLILEGHMEIKIIQSDQNKVVLSAPKSLIEELTFSQIENRVSIAHNTDAHRNQIGITVYAQSLESLNLINPDEVTIEGFQQQEMNIEVESHHDISAFIEALSLDLNLSGRHQFKLKGIGENLNVILNKNAKLDAKHFNVINATAEGSNFRQSSINVSETFTTDYPNRFDITGKPKIITQEVAN